MAHENSQVSVVSDKVGYLYKKVINSDASKICGLVH